MKIQTLENYIKLLQILSSGKNLEIKTIQKKLDMKYNTLHTALNKWADAGFINKIRKEQILLGGDKDEYVISNKGVEFIKQLVIDLQKNLDLRDLITIKEEIIEFTNDIPNYLKELQVVLNDQQQKKLKSKLKKFVFKLKRD